MIIKDIISGCDLWSAILLTKKSLIKKLLLDGWIGTSHTKLVWERLELLA